MRICGKLPEFIINENELTGIILYSDFVSEHEHGIKTLASQFGIINYNTPDEGPIGINRRKASKIPNNLLFQEEKGIAGLSVGLHIYNTKNPNVLNNIPSELKSFNHSSNSITAAWDSSGFCILTKGEDSIRNLKNIYEQIKLCNVVIFLGKNSGIRNYNLNIIICDKMVSENM